MTAPAIEPQNVKLAATWNAGGQHYDRISQTIADSIEHCVHRLAPRPGERVLDVATGTGWTARRVAARGTTPPVPRALVAGSGLNVVRFMEQAYGHGERARSQTPSLQAR